MVGSKGILADLCHRHADSDSQSVYACRNRSDYHILDSVQVTYFLIPPDSLQDHGPADIQQQQEADPPCSLADESHEKVTEQPADKHQQGLDRCEYDRYQ